MSQDDVFWQSEGDRWFARNRTALEDPKVDWVGRLLETLGGVEEISSALDLGCANGWRLARLKERFWRDLPVKCVGVDVSEAALREGERRYPGIEFVRGALSTIPIQAGFDLVIVNFVLHWVARERLAQTISEIDRVVRDGGLLILSDFLPNGQVRTPYHHLPDQEIFTYKQNYPGIFEALGTYREIARLAFDTDAGDYRVQASSSRSRAVCSALRKSLHEYYEAAAFTTVKTS